MSQNIVSLELLNPRGEIEAPPVYIPSPRLSGLEGKKIGLYSNGKQGVDHFFTAIEDLLKQRYPDTTTKRLTGAFEIRDEEVNDFITDIDAFIYAIGD
jgi:hypothetical protein